MSDIESTIRIHDDFTESLKDLSSSLKETIMMSDRTERSVFALGESFADAGGAIGDAISSLKESDNVLEGLLGAFDALSSSDVLMDLADNFDRLSDKYELLVKKVDFGGNRFKSAFKSLKTDVKSLFSETSSAMKSAFRETTTAARNLKSSLSWIYKDDIGNYLEPKLRKISEFNNRVYANTVGRATNAYGNAREFLGSGEVMNRLTEAFENTKTSVINVANRAYGTITNTLDVGRGIVLDNISNARAFMHELSIGATNARELAMLHGASNAGGYVAAGKNVGRTLRRSAISTYNSIKTGAIGTYNSAAERATASYNSLKSVIEGELDSLKQISSTFQLTFKHHIDTFTKNIKNIKLPDLKEFGEKVSESFRGMKSSTGIFSKGMKALGGLGKAFAKELIKETMKISIFRGIEKGLERFIESLKDLAKDVYQKQKEIISRNIENIGRQDKVTAMYGKAGSDDIEAKALDFGNAIGQSNETVASLLTEGAYRGLGTNNTMRLLKLSDKISSLKPGATFEDTARSLIDNFVSGHDASGLSQMLNQGQKGERSARRMGFERALNAGNLDKALDIAEKITEQAGYTDEKYASTQNSLSKTYTRVYNTINSIKSKLDEIIARSLSPMLERMDKFLTSSGGKRFMDTLIAGASLWGKALNFAMTKLLDMLESLGNSVVVLGVVKVWLLIRQFKMLVRTIKFIGPIIMKYVLPAIGFITNKVVILGAKLKLVSAAFAKSTKEIGFMKAAMNSLGKVMIRTFLPIIAVAGILVGAVKGMEALVNSNATDDSEKVNAIGIITGALVFIKDVVKNIYIGVKDLLAYFTWGKKYSDILVEEATAKANTQLNFKKDNELMAIRYEKMIEDAEKKVSEFERSALQKEKSGDMAGATKDRNLADAQRSIIKTATSSREERLARAKEFEALYEEARKQINSPYTEMSEMMKHYDEAVKAKTWGEMADVTGLTGVWDNMFGVVNDIKKELGLVVEDGEDIKSDTDVIRRANEQEEELRWMKAFSDRQITSSYNNMTSNTRNVTINGMSQAGIAEMGRRSISAMPSRKAG